MPSSSPHGFSLLEMFVAFFIVAILLAIALPSLQQLLNRTEEDVLQKQLLQAIQWARQESQQQNISVSLCKSKNHVSCGGRWTDGLLIFRDENEDGLIHRHEQRLAVIHIRSPNGMLYWRSYPYYREDVLFSPLAWADSDNDANGTFWYCPKAQERPSWAVMLSKSGKTRVAYPDQDGIINDSNGKAIRCEA